MKKNHPHIFILFVPGGCTSLFQPLDVGIQRVLKHSMRCSAHRDLVQEASALLESDLDTFQLDTTIGTLRDRSLGWIVKAMHDISDKTLVKKVGYDILNMT